LKKLFGKFIFEFILNGVMTSYTTLLLLLIFDLTSGYPEHTGWKLAFNLNADDGHNFGYQTKAWEDQTDIGTDANAFTADYKSYAVTLETANFIAIVRHQDGVCEAARVWKFRTQGKALRDYLDSSKTSKLFATYDNFTYHFTSPNMLNKDKDPIFAVEGGLVFNWQWADNAVRIGNSKAFCPGDIVANHHDNYFGLGNDLWMGSMVNLWFDVGVYQDRCDSPYRNGQGSDHGVHVTGVELYGQYAIYVSDTEETFPCEAFDLKIVVPDSFIIAGFARVDRSESGFLSIDELVFDFADKDGDGLISPLEYYEARENKDFGGTVTDEDVDIDFNRVDSDGNMMLSFHEILFDTIDADKDGVISLEEYTQAHMDHSLGETE